MFARRLGQLAFLVYFHFNEIRVFSYMARGVVFAVPLLYFPPFVENCTEETFF